MVSYEDNDYEECDEQELDDMINLLMGPAAAESTTPAPVLAQLTADSTNGDTGPLSQNVLKSDNDPTPPFQRMMKRTQ